MSLVCRRLLDQRFFRSVRGNLLAQASRIRANPCNRSLHKKSGAINFTWGQRIFKGFSIVVIIEFVCLGISYVQWTMMNRDPDYRLSINIFSFAEIRVRYPYMQVQYDPKQHGQYDA